MVSFGVAAPTNVGTIGNNPNVATEPDVKPLPWMIVVTPPLAAPEEA